MTPDEHFSIKTVDEIATSEGVHRRFRHFGPRCQLRVGRHKVAPREISTQEAWRAKAGKCMFPDVFQLSVRLEQGVRVG